VKVEIKNQTYDLIVCCCHPIVGWVAIQNPDTGKRYLISDIPKEFQHEYSRGDKYDDPPKDVDCYINKYGVIICYDSIKAMQIIDRYDFKNKT